MRARVGLLGDLDLAKPTHRELQAAVACFPDAVEPSWLPSDDPAARELADLDALWVIPGTPYRDEDAVQAAIAWALDSRTPLLGTCGGFQHTLLVLARRLAGISDATHAETDADAAQPLVAPLACSLIGEQREVRPVPGTRLAAIIGTQPFPGVHWCSYGLAELFVPALEAAGVVISARAPDAGVEAIELPDHPFFVATLFQPQIGTLRRRRLHPLITAFLDAAQSHSRSLSRQ